VHKKILFFRRKESHGKATNQEINQSINQINPHNFFIRPSLKNSFEEVHKHLNLLKFLVIYSNQFFGP
jgi:hypothetical protein